VLHIHLPPSLRGRIISRASRASHPLPPTSCSLLCVSSLSAVSAACCRFFLYDLSAVFGSAACIIFAQPHLTQPGACPRRARRSVGKHAFVISKGAPFIFY